jgi:hypothetical protein
MSAYMYFGMYQVHLLQDLIKVDRGSTTFGVQVATMGETNQDYEK